MYYEDPTNSEANQGCLLRNRQTEKLNNKPTFQKIHIKPKQNLSAEKSVRSAERNDDSVVQLTTEEREGVPDWNDKTKERRQTKTAARTRKLEGVT